MARFLHASIAAFSVAATFVFASNAHAGFNMRKLQLDLPRPAAQMREGETQMAPIAYVRFCLRNSEQCEKADSHDRVELSAENWATIREVNAEINERIKPDPQKGFFDWSVTATVGNCNDYAVQKRKILIEKGFPRAALSLSVVMTPWGEGHLVLTVRTDRGDYVLDNLRPTILAWDRTGYEFNRVQSIEDPATWVHPERGHRDNHHRDNEDMAAKRSSPTTDL